ncbi:NADH-quinone oxidoreductase subunit J family protein [Miltoncostaea marina]|uniref:NADH-quinone oxidoreductase subunit J family protein n=1 Tax=Miltoncostaea marina TaxID=2843215 RepID=UPI001C3DAFAC|nr:NADH-quinone oxidoreductase subunit J [Miltoncostaea marina]
MGERIVFTVAAASAIACGILVITQKAPFRATVALIGTLLSVAVMFVLLMAPFVAAIQVIVYAGAIVVLFLFVIAYLGERPQVEPGDRLVRYQAFAWLAVIGLGIQGVVVLATTDLPGMRDDPRPTGDIGSPEAIGRSFIDDNIVAFEATSLALLVAAVGAVMLAKRAIRAEGGR